MIHQTKNIFIVGIKGVAMANLSVILKKMGKNISGSDLEEEFITDNLLSKNNINWVKDFSSRYLPRSTDLLVYSAAHGGSQNPQVIEAKKRNVKTVSQAELLGDLAKQFKTTLAVCGCHGKTTTSSFLSYALIKLGANPSYMIGSSSFNSYGGGDYLGSEYFVVEADEYGVNPPLDKTPKFHYLNPNYILCTNIDFDHPDVYQSIEEIKQSFLAFFKNNLRMSLSKLFFCSDDPQLMSVAKKLPRSSYLTYGYSKYADLRIIETKITAQNSEFVIVGNRHACSLPKKKITISLFGEKNISNATGVILTLLKLGFPISGIKKAVKDFTGAKRRFEFIYKKGHTYLFDDYAHHPKEIETMIKATRGRFPSSKIIVIFQPHTYSRTQTLLKDFARSLSLADQALILPIFPSARENIKWFKVTSEDIEKQDSSGHVKSVKSKNQLIDLLSPILSTKSLSPSGRHSQVIIFTMGAGDVYKLKDDIIKVISNVKTQSAKWRTNIK